MDPQPDEPTPAPRGQKPRSTTARGVKKPASTARQPGTPARAPGAPRASRSTARKPTAGRPAAAAASAAAAEVVADDEAMAKAGGAAEVAAPEGSAADVEVPEAAAPEVAAKPVVEPRPAVETPEVEVLDASPEPEPEPEPELEREPAASPAPVEPAVARVVAPLGEPAEGTALAVRGLTKRFGGTVAVDGIDLDVPSGCFYGFVGPNGAGKTTTLSMVTGLLRPDAGTAVVNGSDIWTRPRDAKRSLGVLPDRLRVFDLLTGAEYLQHAGALHGLDRATTARRAADLIQAFGLESASRRLVSDFSAGMVKKLAIAAAMIHSPRLLVLDEPFESVDPVSAQLVIGVLQKFAAAGGTVLLSSHSMDLVQRVCDYVAVIAEGRLLAAGPMADILDGASLEDRFVELAGGATAVEGMEWLQSFSD